MRCFGPRRGILYGPRLDTAVSVGESDMRRRHTGGEEDSEVNLTPMLDVVFIMLIFFIVTASFVKESGVDVTRPHAATAIRQDRGNILVAITADDQIWIDRHMVDPRALRANIERLHAENPQGALVIQADTASKNFLLIQVMDAARAAGVSNVSLAAEISE